MTKTQLLLSGLSGCLFLVSCEPIPAGPRPRGNPYDRFDRPEPRPYQAPDRRYGPGDSYAPDDGYDSGRDFTPEPRPTRDQYPTAERTNNPNQVLSPYAPYNVIDVEGFRSGQLAKDPSNGKIFRIP